MILNFGYKSVDIEELHKDILKDREIQDKADLDIREWTIASQTLLHAAAKAGNLRALEQLLAKVIN